MRERLAAECACWLLKNPRLRGVEGVVNMSSEILVVLILIAAAILFIFWVRKNDSAKREPDVVNDNATDIDGSNR